MRPETPGEEIANSVIHGIGAGLSVTGLVMIILAAVRLGSAWAITACAVYGATLVILYACSTLYHALANERAKRVFRILDHASIYLLIAGTYTPFTLITLRGPVGWTLFGVIWGSAVIGIVFKCFFINRLKILSTTVYLLMGWCAIFAIRPLLELLPGRGFAWLLAGGLFYSIGVVFFVSRRRYAHALWHLFVIAGSVCHYCVVYRYVLGRA